VTVPDPRVEQYARLMIETCVNVQPGWEVMVVGGVQARPLLVELARQLARRGAYALMRPRFSGNYVCATDWAREAPLELLEHASPIEVDTMQRIDALIAVDAPENTRALKALSPERSSAMMAGVRPAMQRVFDDSLPWVGGQFPTDALAQDAGMATDQFADFLYAAVLRDWDAERERMRRQSELFDAADEVRIVGAETDIRLSIAGRSMIIDAAGRNLPGGEFYTSPVEDSAEGVITFAEFPGIYLGNEVRGIRLRFDGGRVVDASAETGEEFLISTLDTDEGARRLGELGIGCNPAITRHMKNVLFDEKMDGTIHLAVGNSVSGVGGANVSAIHWDIVKDVRREGRIELDGRVVQQDGVWQPAA
jgi:aminopeptidase